MAVRVGDFLYITVDWNQLLIMGQLIRIHNNYSMSLRWIGSDKITNERVARVGYNHFISNKGECNNNCFSKFSNQVLLPIKFFISTILQSVRKEHTISGHTRPNSRHHLIIT